jgi:hypothetical protein
MILKHGLRMLYDPTNESDPVVARGTQIIDQNTTNTETAIRQAVDLHQIARDHDKKLDSLGLCVRSFHTFVMER